MQFQLHIEDTNLLTASIGYADWTRTIQLHRGYWSADDYSAHWGYTSYALLDYYRTKLLIIEARAPGCKNACRALRVCRIGNRFHFQDVLLVAPSRQAGYKGEPLIRWIDRGKTPLMESGDVMQRKHQIPEFIVEMKHFEDWHNSIKMPASYRDVDELTTNSDCA